MQTQKRLSIIWLGIFCLLFLSACGLQVSFGEKPTPEVIVVTTTPPVATNRPTTVAATVSTAAPAPTQVSSQNTSTMNLKPFCNCQQTIAEGQPLALRYGWLAASSQYVTDYLQASTRTVYIDGKRYDNVERYWQPTAYSASDKGYTAYWLFPLPLLSPGMHTIETFVDVQREITDGFDDDKDGTPDTYSPSDSTHGHVDVLIGSSAAVGGKCANGGAAGTFRYTMILPANYTSETWFDGKHETLRPGENAFYLSANQTHQQSTVGGHRVTLQEPECVTRTWRDPSSAATLITPRPSSPIAYQSPVPAMPASFADDYSTPRFLTAWDDASCRTYYADGQYHIHVKKQWLNCWAFYTRAYKNFTMEVDTTMYSGEGWGGGGSTIIFGAKDDHTTDGYYQFAVTRLVGYYRLGQIVNDKWVGPDWEKGARLDGPDLNNVTRAHLKLIVQGQKAQMYANGNLLKAIDLTGYQGGLIALSGTAYGQDAHVSFDNFKIAALP